MKLTRAALIRNQMLEFREEEMVPEGFTSKFDGVIQIMSLNSFWHLLGWHLLGHYGSKSHSGQAFFRRSV